MRLIRAGFLGLAIWLTPSAGSNNATSLVDLAQCALRVTRVEQIDEIVLTSGNMFVAADKRNHLIALSLEGAAPHAGQILLTASLFGATYHVGEHILLTVAEAVGFRTRDDAAEPKDIWTDHVGNALVLTPQVAGEILRFRLAFEIPKSADEVTLCIPTVLPEPVMLGE